MEESSPQLKLTRAHSKVDARSQLKSARSARAKDLRETRAGLTECDAGKIAAMAGEVRGIVDVEDFADQRETPALAEHEFPTKPQVERLKIVAEPVTFWQCQRGNWYAFGIESAGMRLIKLCDESLNVGSSHRSVEHVNCGPGQQVIRGPIAVEIVPANEGAEGWSARIRKVKPQQETPWQLCDASDV